MFSAARIAVFPQHFDWKNVTGEVTQEGAQAMLLCFLRQVGQVAFAIIAVLLVNLSAADAGDEQTTTSVEASKPVVSGTGADSNPEYMLVYRFEPNQSVYYEVKHSQTQRVQKTRESQTVTNEVLTRRHFRVVSVDSEKNALLETTIDRIQLSAGAEGEDPIEYDSASGQPVPPEFGGIAKTVGHPLAKVQARPQLHTQVGAGRFGNNCRRNSGAHSGQ
jgi:hypothetical protein